MNDEVRIPDIEVIVGAGSDEVALFCFYQRDDIHQGYDVVAGVSHKDARAVVRAILLDSIKALDTEDWHTMDELREDAAPKTDEPPF